MSFLLRLQYTRSFDEHGAKNLSENLAYPNPTRERGTEFRRFRDDRDQSLAHASGYGKYRKSRMSLVLS